MGVHDFVCYVEQNSQCLLGFEKLEHRRTTRNELLEDIRENGGDEEELDDLENWDDMISSIAECNDSVGSSRAILVLLPRDMSYKEVTSVPLSKLKMYPIREEEYSWDGWDFPEYPGYSEFLMSEKEIDSGAGVWYNADNWIINFSPSVYQAFVQRTFSYNSIPIVWYAEALSNRGKNAKDFGYDKRAMFEYLSKR